MSDPEFETRYELYGTTWDGTLHTEPWQESDSQRHIECARDILQQSLPLRQWFVVEVTRKVVSASKQ